MNRIVLVLFACSAAAEEWKAGPLTLEVEISRTAHLFHVVDNVAAWNEFCHGQYGEWCKELGDAERQLLRRHAEIRARKGWGGGLEQTFYTARGLDAALAAGVREGHLTEEEARAEKEILLRFAPRADALLKEERPRLEAFRKRIREQLAELEAFSRKVSRFCHGRRASVPVYLLANPSDRNFGGGYNGGRLTLEVARVADVHPTLLHELMHAFLDPEKPRLEEAARRAEGLDAQTLNEGIAYALSPGLFHAGSDLAAQAEAHRKAGRGVEDSYARFSYYGLALVPLLREALDDEKATLETFLPRALEAWKALPERKAPPKAPESAAFSAGPCHQELGRRLRNLYSFNHGAEGYGRVLAKARPGQTLVLMFALDHEDRNVPAEYADLLPRPWAEIEKELKAGKLVEMTGAARELNIVLLAAPTKEKLAELVDSTPLVGRQPP
ncbi:MAG: hypothetical protein ACREID_07515 [Planctomycetota bacterium]